MDRVSNYLKPAIGIGQFSSGDLVLSRVPIEEWDSAGAIDLRTTSDAEVRALPYEFSIAGARRQK